MLTVNFDYAVTVSDDVRVFVIPYSNGKPLQNLLSPSEPSLNVGSGSLSYSLWIDSEYQSEVLVDQFRFIMGAESLNQPLYDEYIRAGYIFEPSRIYNQGKLDIKQTWLADLEVEGGDDIWFQANTAVDRYVAPRNGSLLLGMGRFRPTEAMCHAANLRPERISVDEKSNSQYFCIRTNQGRVGRFQITAPVGPSPGVLSIEYVIWSDSAPLLKFTL